VWECDKGQRDLQAHRHTDRNTQTAETNIHFASATPHAKRNEKAKTYNTFKDRHKH